MSVVIAGAKGLREIVIEPFKVVHWIICGLEGEAVIYADDGAIFIFDLQERKLHKLIGEESYSFNVITNVWYNRGVMRVEVQMDVEHDLLAGLRPGMPFPALKRLFALSAIHQPTRERIRRIFLSNG